MIRVWIGLAVAGALLAALGGIYWKGQHDAAERWRPKAEAAERQAELNANATQSLDRHTVTVRVIEKQVSTAQEAVRNDPGASDVFEPAATLCDQLRRMRDGEPACEPDNPPDLP